MGGTLEISMETEVYGCSGVGLFFSNLTIERPRLWIMEIILLRYGATSEYIYICISLGK